jgi:hypothetical protein
MVLGHETNPVDLGGVSVPLDPAPITVVVVVRVVRVGWATIAASGSGCKQGASGALAS